jgi:hypothetical protein
MASSKPLVDVIGLKGVRRDMVRFGDESVPAAMIEAGQAVMEPIAVRIAGKLRGLPRASGRLAGTVRVSKVRTGASMRVGTAGVPYTGPVEFGAWPPGRPFKKGGRYIFPTAGDMADEAARRYSELVQKQIDRFPWSQAHD